MATTTKTSVNYNRKVSASGSKPSAQRRFPPLRVADAGNVRIGGQGPVFRLTADAGKVRLGGQGPVFRLTADAGKVRLGGQGPVFRPGAVADAGRVRLGGQGPVFR